MAIIKKIYTKKRYGEIGALIYGMATVEKQFGNYSEVKHSVTRRPNNFTLRYIPRRNESIYTKKLYTMFLAALFTIDKEWRRWPLTNE
jgi:hypothetical protein